MSSSSAFQSLACGFWHFLAPAVCIKRSCRSRSNLYCSAEASSSIAANGRGEQFVRRDGVQGEGTGDGEVQLSARCVLAVSTSLVVAPE